MRNTFQVILFLVTCLLAQSASANDSLLDYKGGYLVFDQDIKVPSGALSVYIMGNEVSYNERFKIEADVWQGNYCILELKVDYKNRYIPADSKLQLDMVIDLPETPYDGLRNRSRGFSVKSLRGGAVKGLTCYSHSYNYRQGYVTKRDIYDPENISPTDVSKITGGKLRLEKADSYEAIRMEEESPNQASAR